MKVLIVVSALLAACSAQLVVSPWGLTHPLTLGIGTPLVTSRLVQPIIAPTITVPTSSQYRVQDELGQFAFGHRGDNQARDEVKTFDGSVRGAYSYVDPTGKLINVQYLADHNGYRVLGANNLPVAPEVPAVVELKGPEPVSDTAEVVAARANFAREFAKATEGAEKKDKMPEMDEKKEEKKDRRRRDVLWNLPLTRTLPLTTLGLHTAPVLTHSVITHPVLPLAKTVVKTSEFKPIDAKTPAATRKAEIEVKEHEIISPWGIHPWTTPLLTKTVELEKKEDDKDKKEIISPWGIHPWGTTLLARTVDLEKKDDKKDDKEVEKLKFFSPLPLASTIIL